jgi:hypothetical protein
MQFKLPLDRPIPDLHRLQSLVRDEDPAALIGLDRAGATLRIASSLRRHELCVLLERAGYPVQSNALLDVPSECCGGCGG